MRLPIPPGTGNPPPGWFQKLHAAFAQGLGFPGRFQMGSNEENDEVFSGGVFITARKGDPTNSGQATDSDPVGSVFLRLDGGTGSTLYIKEGAGAAGWIAK